MKHVAALILLAAQVHAAYLRDVPQRILQPDGTSLDCFATGDEFYSWLHDEHGFTIMRDPATGYFVYAQERNGDLLPTVHVFGKVDPASTDLSPHARYGDYLRRQRYVQSEIPASRSVLQTPTVGVVRNLVFFVRFSDQSEFPAVGADYYDMFANPNASSMLAYFSEVSQSQLAVTSHFVSTSGDVVSSWQDSHERAYYEVFDPIVNPIGYHDADERKEREQTLVANVINAQHNFIPDLDYDYDDDGFVDNVTLVVRGGPEGWSQLLWPHQWVLDSQTASAQVKGADVLAYNFQLEVGLSVSVLCHEFFHSLGAPDLYEEVAYPGYDPVGKWDLMSTDVAQHMLTYMKSEYGHWMASVPEITHQGSYALQPISKALPFECYKIPSPNSPTEYFMVEYRRQDGEFEINLPGSGLIVYRVDGELGGVGNLAGPPYEVQVVAPPGKIWLAHQNVEVSDGTPAAGSLNASKFGGLNIYDIVIEENVASFKVGGVLYVDASWMGTENGMFSTPFNTVAEALAVRSAHDVIVLKSGDYTGAGNAPISVVETEADARPVRLMVPMGLPVEIH